MSFPKIQQPLRAAATTFSGGPLAGLRHHHCPASSSLSLSLRTAPYCSTRLHLASVEAALPPLTDRSRPLASFSSSDAATPSRSCHLQPSAASTVTLAFTLCLRPPAALYPSHNTLLHLRFTTIKQQPILFSTQQSI